MADQRKKKQQAAKPAKKPEPEKPVEPEPQPPTPAPATPPQAPPPVTAVPMSASELGQGGAAAHATAMIQAKFTIAQARPRSMAKVRERLLEACARPRFAETARYVRPVGGGKKARGWSIRFAEAGIQAMGNIHTATHVIFDDDERRGIRVEVIDLETNTSYDAQWIIQKTVERRTLKDGQVPIRQRINSSNVVVYLVAATEEDVLQKQNNLASKALRNCGLRLVPGDILDECLDAIMQPADGKTLTDWLKDAADSFKKIGIPVTELEKYLGHALSDSTGEELHDLRGIYTAIRDGETQWTVIAENGNGGSEATGSLNVNDLPGTGEADGSPE